MDENTSAGDASGPDSGAVPAAPGTPLSEDERRRIEARFATIPLAPSLGVRMTRLERGECDPEVADRRDLDGIFESLRGATLATGAVDLEGRQSGTLFATSGLTYMRLRPRA